MKKFFSTEVKFAGLPVSSGVAFGKVCLFNERRHENLPIYKVSGEGIEKEKSRLRQAIKISSQQLEDLKNDIFQRLGKPEAEIFVAQKMILEDEPIQKQMFEAIETLKQNAEAAATYTLDTWESRLSKVDVEYIKERSTDIGEIKRRLLDILGNMNPSLQCAGEPHCQRGKNRIVIAKELTPTLTLGLDIENTLGFVTEHGGVTSHAAILARALGIPAVTGIKGIHNDIACGTEVLINGDTGELIIWPSDKTLSSIESSKAIAPKGTEILGPIEGLTVMSNIRLADDIKEVIEANSEGIGLYRTEFEFFAAGRPLSEDQQFEIYSSVIKAMEGKPVYFRLLDLGGDKEAPFLNIQKEENPYLGCRGSRLLLKRPDLLKPQARALARASVYGPVYIIYPMIVDLEQFLTLRNIFNQATEDLKKGKIYHGVMFEVPSACLQAKEILKEADFGSIGSNDLIQYLFAVDRNNDVVAYDYSPDKPVFWFLISQIAKASLENKKPVSMCGELAGDPKYTSKLLEVGINILSVNTRSIPAIRLEGKKWLS